jgi:hypothetical protein
MHDTWISAQLPDRKKIVSVILLNAANGYNYGVDPSLGNLNNLRIITRINNRLINAANATPTTN